MATSFFVITLLYADASLNVKAIGGVAFFIASTAVARIGIQTRSAIGRTGNRIAMPRSISGIGCVVESLRPDGLLPGTFDLLGDYQFSPG